MSLGWLLPVLLARLVPILGAETPSEASSLRLVPFPKEVALREGRFELKEPLFLEMGSEASPAASELLGVELARLGVKTRKQGSLAGAFAILSHSDAPRGPLAKPDFRANPTAEDYVLTVLPNEIVIAGSGPAGLFYGVQTLLQLLRANQEGKSIPCLAIRDWPSLRWRCFQDDLTRGPSSTLDELKREVALGAGLKMNLFTYYMEHQFAFSKHPEIGPKDGSLTPDELKALVAWGKPLGVDILGNQQSFGHFGNILRHERYKPLAETGGVLCPVKEESYQLLDDLYSEVVPLLPFPFFNVCCDETYGLGTGPSKELAAKIGVGGVYARHLRRVHDLLKDKYGKRMMMWGDIILQHPGDLKEIPTDTIMLTWGYHPGASFEGQIVPFAKSGYEFFVCPGTSCWSRILPDFGVAVTNIQNFVRDGAKHGAMGMLNTAWDDDGESLNAPNWHGYAWGAECSWNASKTPIADFNRRIGAVLFGEKGDRFGRAIERLAKTHRLPGMNAMGDGRFWQDDLGPMKSSAAIERAAAGKLLEVVRPAIEHLAACQKEATANADLLDFFLFGARRMELIGQRMLDRLEAVAAYNAAYEGAVKDAAPLLEKAEAILARNRDAHEALGKQYAELWARENKPYALDRVMGRFKSVTARYDGLAKRLAAIRKDAEAGKPLPSPKQVGLELVELGVRRTRPSRVERVPLQPDAPWAEPSATHRLGLVVGAGSVDRVDVPVELDLRLPADLASRPVRAFVAEGEKPREVLAQLDPADGDRSRLALLLDGPLAKGASAAVQVYLGLPKPGPGLPTAAATADAPKGMKVLENDQVRLLLGPEGGHIYRWEVKALGNRDLTVPGETGWAGFADTGGEHRGSPNKLACLARGPALVRYACTDEQGLVKTVSLFGGAAWAEVTLNSPVWYYWALDNPKNFAADGPTPGTYLFSTGATGPVGKEADGVDAQVKPGGAHWSVKFSPDRLALGLVTPEVAAAHVVAPGAGAGGVGIEGGATASHFIHFGGILPGKPEETMGQLQRTLDFRNPPEITLHSIQPR